MRRSRIQTSASRVSLFPFLAVLLCTMGSLIVILVVLSHQAKASAKREREANANTHSPKLAGGTDPAATAIDTEAELEMIEWQVELLTESRTKTAADLARDRRALNQVDDHVRRLRAEWQRIKAAAAALRQSGQQTAGDVERREQQLAALRQQILELSQTVDQLRKERSREKPSYSIVPYEGPNGTRRRPMFIECRRAAVILQPEGVVLEAADFAEPLGPDNPLAAALRAATGYLAEVGVTRPGDEPYPLALIRPGGIAAYYKVRAAIRSWDSDFGYELVDDDWDLEFPPADRRLAEVERRAIEEARARQQLLARAAPSRYRDRMPVYRARPSGGGFMRVDDGAGTGGDGSGHAPGGSSEPSGGPGGLARGTAGQPRGVQSGGERTQSQSTTNGDAANRRFGPSGSPQSPNSARGGPGGQAAAGGTQRSNAAGNQSAQPFSTGDARARDWALPEGSRGAVPVSRPVRVMVRPDRFVILTDRGRVADKEVTVPGRTDESIDEFVSALWEHMETWGIAGNGMYWKPTLVLQAAPDAAGRAAELRELLEGSGVEVMGTGENEDN